MIREIMGLSSGILVGIWDGAQIADTFVWHVYNYH
jgi:hypothetical protein